MTVGFGTLPQTTNAFSMTNTLRPSGPMTVR
jgi:hypothetical protein